MGDLLRLNKSFIISRSGDSKKEIYNNLLNASAFINNKLSNNQHVWIAQRQGRSRDGIDSTDPAVLKMLHLKQRKEFAFEELTNHINIIPCSISYEFDPLDKEKAQKLLNKSSEKTPHEDVEHIFKGITQKRVLFTLIYVRKLKVAFLQMN